MRSHACTEGENREDASSAPLLQFDRVSRSFVVRNGIFSEKKQLQAVENVSFSIRKGECVGLVGESGCGKSTLGRIACGLTAPTSGEVRLLGKPLPPAGAGSWAAGRLQMVFQDPFSSLNPRMTVGASVAEPLAARGMPKAERLKKADDMLSMVGLVGVSQRYPHEFSGGQRQRIAVARALITEPDVVVCDEPVSALDASVQAQVINLLCDMQERFAPAYLFISHDLNIVGFMCSRILVMYLGEIVEEGSRERLFAHARHPYTRALLAARPGEVAGEEPLLRGEVPSPIDRPQGCAFHPRCPKAADLCRSTKPELHECENGWYVRCHLV